MLKSDRLNLSLILLAACAGVVFSGAVHELGHALAARKVGMHVTSVQPWLFLGSPHVTFEGSGSDRAWAAIHGAGLLAAVTTGLMGTAVAGLLVRRGSRFAALTWLFIPFLGQTLAWVFLPIAMACGANVQGDDSAKFVRASGWHPLWVSCVAFVLVLLCVALVITLYRQRRLLLVVDRAAGSAT